jgi:drug/metabolite transporter (DMT)-like permease
MLIGVAAALLACVGYGTASVLQSYAAGRSVMSGADNGPTLRSTIGAMLAPIFIAGMALDLLGFVGSLVSARLIPLFLSQTIISANLVVTAVLSIFVLHVRLHRRDWTAIAIVLVALCILGATAGRLGSRDPGAVMHWGVLVVSAVILGLGAALVRLLGRNAAVPAGLIAGVLYGAMAVAIRLVDGLDPLDLRVLIADPATWAVVLAGLGGFYLFTVALQVGSVNGVAAALVVGETVVPGIVGVVLLGDVSRPGYGALVVIAFIAAVGGAVALAFSSAAEYERAQSSSQPGPTRPEEAI